MLHQVNLSASSVSPENSHRAAVLEDLKKIEKLKFKVFQTSVVNVDKEDQTTFVFLTASKDAHLGVGRLSSIGKYHLAKLLDHEFTQHRCAELMLQFDIINGFLVTRTIQDDRTCFTFFPAH